MATLVDNKVLSQMQLFYYEISITTTKCFRFEIFKNRKTYEL